LKELSIYIHWPFCKKKCPYCDFNSHVRNKIDSVKWLQSYLSEIDYFKDLISDRKITSIFFGGGTPSLMPPYIVEKIIDKLYSISKLNNVEISLEANPTSSENQKFKDFKAAGINRLSIGIQSLNQNDLEFLGREHSVSEAIETITIASSVFDNYSLDLIYSRPKQTAQEWVQELTKILEYSKDHISLYQLTIEKGTDFYSQYQKGKFIMPDQELSADIYEITNEILANNGLMRYEISNYAKAKKECKHNINYWKYNEYLGIGPGAHSRIKLNHNDVSAIMMIHNPEKWQDHVQKKQNGIQYKKTLSITEIATEYILMGLRLEKGIKFNDFKTKFVYDLNDFINQEKLDLYMKNKLLTYNNKNLTLTNRGKMLLNHISMELIKI
jgi:putative oxygen-independent coproporphyrinogen III oxidase